jgi:ParB/RepB/Spo0J family partition protein
MAGVILVELAVVADDPANPRGDVGDVTDLRLSIAQRGLQAPIEVIGAGDGRYMMFEGHRRRKALEELGMTHAPAIVKTFATERDRILAQGTIHAHRKDFNPMAWARYLHRLYWNHNMTRDEIAFQLGVSRAWVRDTLSFVHLDEAEQRGLESGFLSRREVLTRLAARRAERDGRPAPQPKTTTAPAVKIPAQRVPAPEPHLNSNHRLAEHVAARCASAGPEHAAAPKIGGVACGRCWEDGIRADATTTARPALVAA